MSSFLDRVAGAPISWGVCEVPGWGTQLSVDRVLSEAQSLGLTAFEQGALGWLPTDPDTQRATLAGYGMTLVGGFVPLVLHDPDQRNATMSQAEAVASNMAAAGGSVFITAVVASADDWFRPDLDASHWSELFANLECVDRIAKAHGLTQAIHPHLDTLIETNDEIDRLLECCDLAITFDIGHMSIGGVDVVDVATKQFDRIALVHLKDVNGELAARQQTGELSLMSATQAGLFPALGEGEVPVASVIEVLENAGYSGYYTVETDQALTEGEPARHEGPLLTQTRSLDFLRSLT